MFTISYALIENNKSWSGMDPKTKRSLNVAIHSEFWALLFPYKNENWNYLMSKVLWNLKPMLSYTVSIKHPFLINSHFFSIPIPYNASSPVPVTTKVIYIYLRDHSRSVTKTFFPRPKRQNNNRILVLCLSQKSCRMSFPTALFPRWQ